MDVFSVCRGSADNLHDVGRSPIGVDYCRACGLVVTSVMDRHLPAELVVYPPPAKMPPRPKPAVAPVAPRPKPVPKGTLMRPRRELVIERDQGRCRYCGVLCARRYHHPRPPNALTIDHVLPRSRGGTNSMENTVVACDRCNNAKGDGTPEEAGMELLPVGSASRDGARGTVGP